MKNKKETKLEIKYAMYRMKYNDTWEAIIDHFWGWADSLDLKFKPPIKIPCFKDPCDLDEIFSTKGIVNKKEMKEVFLCWKKHEKYK